MAGVCFTLAVREVRPGGSGKGWEPPGRAQRAGSGGCSGGVGAGLPLIPIALEIAIEAGAANAQDLSGTQAVAVAHLQYLLDMIPSNVVEGERLPIFVSRKTWRTMLKMFRKIAEVDEVTGGGDARGGNDIFQFTNVAGPGMLQEDGLRAAGQTGNIFSIGVVVFFEEELHEKRNVFEAFGERRDADLNGAEAIEEIFAEASGENLGAKIAIGGGNQADIDLFDFRRADALDFAVLNHAEQFGLHSQRSFADFVEEHCAAVGIFKKTRASVGRAGECAADMTEELAFEQGIHKGGAIAHGEALLRDRANLMDGARDEFLTDARRANEQDIRVVTGNFAGEVEDFQHGGTFPDDAVKLEIFEKLFLEGADTTALIVERSHIVKSALEAEMVERLGKKISGAAANGLEGGFQRVFSGHQDQVNAGIAAKRAGQEFVAIRGIEADAGKHEAAAAQTDQAECLFGIAGANGLIAHIGDERVERIALGGVVVENTRRQSAANGGDFNGFVRGVSHAMERGNRCAKGNEGCFESEGL